MLIIGLILLTTGFIVIYKGTFACKYLVSNSVFSFIASIIVMSFDELSYIIIALTALLIIGLFLHYNFNTTSISPKEKYIIFNIETYDLMEILSEILKKQNINYYITNHSILLDLTDEIVVEVKPKLLGLNILFLSDVISTDLLTLIKDELDNALSQVSHKRIPLFGTIVFVTGFISIVSFYISII